MKTSFLTSNFSMESWKLIFSIILILNINESYSQSYPVPAMNVQIETIRDEAIEFPSTPFSISELITVKEFNIYLNSIKVDSTKEYYQSQLPKSFTFSNELLNEILKNEDLQDKPMPGVSWIVARNYCQWLNEKSKIKGTDFQFDLPLFTDMIAYEKTYKHLKTKNLSTWTLDSYDESWYEMSKYSPNYRYDAEENDPPALKRKIHIGASYHMDYEPFSTYMPYNYEYQDSSSRYVGFRVVKRHKESNRSIDNVNNSNVTFQFENNNFTGLYQEKYPSGQIKVLGEFFKGQRIGIWTIWNENGKLEIQREYIHNKDFKFLYPVNDHPYKKIYEKYAEYTLKRNSDGFYPYLHIEERAVPYSKRSWMLLTKENEPELFNSIVFKTLIKSTLDEKIGIYEYGLYGDFKNKLEDDDLVQMQAEYGNWDYNRVEIKEDFLFNIDNLMCETRPIGLSFYKNTTDEKPSYTLYIPYIRALLAKTEIKIQGFDQVENVSDYFFFNLYRGEHIKHEDKSFKLKMINDDSVDLLLDCEKLTMEHRLWKAYGR